MYCTVCGKELHDEAVVCTGCGCMVKKNPTNQSSKAPIATILGIIGIVTAWLFALAGHITSIIGIVYGIREYKETNKMTGLVLSIIGEVCSIFSSIVGAVLMSGVL